MSGIFRALEGWGDEESLKARTFSQGDLFAMKRAPY
jgi:hypothetical protein